MERCSFWDLLVEETMKDNKQFRGSFLFKIGNSRDMLEIPEDSYRQAIILTYC